MSWLKNLFKRKQDHFYETIRELPDCTPIKLQNFYFSYIPAFHYTNLITFRIYSLKLEEKLFEFVYERNVGWYATDTQSVVFQKLIEEYVLVTLKQEKLEKEKKLQKLRNELYESCIQSTKT